MKKLKAVKIKSENSNTNDSGKKDFLIVGIGASAGGIEALKRFFASVPRDSGMAFVVVLHLLPNHESNLAAILQTAAAIPVAQVKETVKIEPNRVYVIPPDKNLTLSDSHIELSELQNTYGTRTAIDFFFRSLADAYGKRAVAVILSDAGTDGTLGLKRVKENGGFTLVQNESEAEFNSVPHSAIAANLADLVLSVEEMPARLILLRQTAEKLDFTDDENPAPEINRESILREVLTLLEIRTGHDFSSYKRPTLLRRIARRLPVHGFADIGAYLEFLREQPEELNALLADLLISVTNFFRDKETFEALEKEVVPKLFAGKTSKDTIRVWVCGCATGEEAYSLAIILSEYAGHLTEPPKIQIFASDINEQAVAAARRAHYDESIEADVSPERLRRFFAREVGSYRVKKHLREIILFAPHNVLRDPPFSRLDLITCRNLLIYLARETQEKVLQTFGFGLNPSGFLFLGASETAENASALFSVVNKKQRIYKSISAKRKNVPSLPTAGGRWEIKTPEPPKLPEQEPFASFGELHYRTVELYAPPSAIINERNEIVHLSRNAGRFLGYAGGELSRNLLKVVNPALRSELQTALLAARQENRRIEARNVRFNLAGDEMLVNLTALPVDAPEAKGFLLILFEEAGKVPETEITAGTLEESGDKASAESAARLIEEELDRTKSRLRTSAERYEVSTEELKAANEEMQAMNEELRSTTEELETGKEEMQSFNEELQTVNLELKDKIEELSRANSDLQNLMASTEVGTLFLDRDLKIKRYTPNAENIFNIISGDVGRSIQHVTHNLEYDRMADDAREVLQKLHVVEREIRSAENRWFLARFLPYKTVEDHIDGVVLTFIDITRRKQSEENLALSEKQYRAIVSQAAAGIGETDLTGKFLFVNDRYCKMLGYTPEELLALGDEDITNPEDFTRNAELLADLYDGGEPFSIEKRYVGKNGKTVWVCNYVSILTDADDRPFSSLSVSIDITERKESEAGLSAATEQLARQTRLFDTTLSSITDFTYNFDNEGRFIYANQPLLDLLGITSEEIVGKNFFDLNYPEDLATRLQSQIKQVFETGETVRDETPFTSPTGEGGFYEYIFSPVKAEGGAVESVAGTTRDVTTRKRLETNLGFAAEISRDLTTLSGIDEIMRNVGAKIGAYLDLSNCALIEINDTEDAAVINHGWHNPDLPDLNGVYRLADYLSDEFQRAGRAGENFIVNDTQTDSRTAAAAYARLKIGAFLAVPVIENDEWRFMLIVYKDAAHVWQTDEIELVNDLTKRIWARLELTRSDEAVRESEEKYRRFVNVTSDVVYQISADWRELRSLDGKNFIRSSSEANENWLEEYIPESDRQRVSDDIEKAIQTKTIYESEHCVNRLDGSIGWAFSRAAPVLDEAGEIVEWLGVASDITKRKKAEEKLRESEERFSKAFNASPLALSISSLATGELVEVNDTFINVTGYTREEAIGKTTIELGLWKNRQDREAEMETVRQTGRMSDAEYTFRTKSGAEIIGLLAAERIEINGEPFALTVIQDITARKQAEQRLRESEEQSDLMIESATDFAIFRVSPENLVASWNAGAEKVFGYAQSEIVGQSVEILFTPEDRKKGVPQKELETALEKGRAEDDRFHVRKDGSRFFASGVMHQLITGEKGFVKIARDMTERIEAEQIKHDKEMLQKLVGAQEDERKRIARDLHDELGQLLTGLRLKLESARQLCEDNDELCGKIDETQTLAKRVDDGVDFLAWELRPAALDDLGLRAALEKYVSEWSHYSGVTAELLGSNFKKTRLAPEAETNLYRIAQESLNNVHKHANAKLVEVSLEKRGADLIVLIINDDGVGFNPKTKINRSKGIGLIGMKERAILIGGTLEIESAPGKGTTIFVRVPVGDGEKGRKGDGELGRIRKK